MSASRQQIEQILSLTKPGQIFQYYTDGNVKILGKVRPPSPPITKMKVEDCLDKIKNDKILRNKLHELARLAEKSEIETVQGDVTWDLYIVAKEGEFWQIHFQFPELDTGDSNFETEQQSILKWGGWHYESDNETQFYMVPHTGPKKSINDLLQDLAPGRDQ